MTNVELTSANDGSRVPQSFNSYVVNLMDNDFNFLVDDPWIVVGEIVSPYSWVLCLSITMQDMRAVLNIVLPILRSFDVPFILVQDSFQHNRINNHAFPTHLYGKPLVIFLKNEKHAVKLSSVLQQKTAGFQALYLPNSIRLGSILYASRIVQVSDDLGLTIGGQNYKLSCGEEEDKSHPFPSAMLSSEPKIKKLIRGRYLPINLITSSHKGNIVKAFDVRRMKWLFAKQASAWAAEDNHGRQMSDRLKWQHYLSEQLSSSLNIPKVRDFVEQDGFSYLISDYVEGHSIDDLIKAENSNTDQIISIYTLAVEELQKLHRQGYVHRDFTAKNILFDLTEKVWLTDLELAAPLVSNGFIPFQSGTFGYMSRSQENSGPPCIADDVYACGALLYYILTAEHPRHLRELTLYELTTKIDLIPIESRYRSIVRICMTDTDGLDLGHVLMLLRNVKPSIDLLTHPVSLPNNGNRSIIYRLIATMFLAFVTVAVLYFSSSRPNDRLNGFLRNFNIQDPILLSQMELPVDILSIAGEFDGDLYMSTSVKGQYARLKDGTAFLERIDISSDSLLRSSLSQKVILHVDSSAISIADGQKSTIIIKSRRSDSVQIIRTRSPFTRAERLTSNSFIVRAFNQEKRDQSFYSFNARDTKFENEQQITEVFGDAGFSTSGFLRCNTAGRCAYVTRFSNRFFITDTILNVLVQANTIDTISNYTVHSKHQKTGSSGVITSGNAPQVINKAIDVTTTAVYVLSRVKADNQDELSYTDHLSIDVYDLHAKYVGSFLVPGKIGDRLRSMRIIDKRMYLLYPGLIQVFSLADDRRLIRNNQI